MTRSCRDRGRASDPCRGSPPTSRRTHRRPTRSKGRTAQPGHRSTGSDVRCDHARGHRRRRCSRRRSAGSGLEEPCASDRCRVRWGPSGRCRLRRPAHRSRAGARRCCCRRSSEEERKVCCPRAVCPRRRGDQRRRRRSHWRRRHRCRPLRCRRRQSPRRAGQRRRSGARTRRCRCRRRFRQRRGRAHSARRCPRWTRCPRPKARR